MTHPIHRIKSPDPIGDLEILAMQVCDSYRPQKCNWCQKVHAPNRYCGYGKDVPESDMNERLFKDFIITHKQQNSTEVHDK